MIEKDIRLVLKAKSGNKRALTKLLKLYYESIYLLAYSYVKNEEDALDVIQEATFKAVSRIDQLKEAEYFSTWLNRIVINESYRLLTKKQKEQRYSGDLEELDVIQDTALNPANRAESKVLLQYIHELDDKYEEVLLLFYFNELSIQEISKLLYTNENTVKTRLSRGREALKIKLELVGFNY